MQKLQEKTLDLQAFCVGEYILNYTSLRTISLKSCFLTQI